MVTALAALVCAATPPRWVKIFDGKTLAGWTAKIRGYDLGDNFADTFRVVGGVIQVNYDKYGGKFDNRFGHLFFERPLSAYRLRLKYRFTGDQLEDGAGWAWRNSGIMLHCQDPKTMGKDQSFPVSAEFQLLGGPELGERTTGNVCTPGTNIVMEGKLETEHCINSDSATFAGDQWVRAEAEVHGSGLVIHRINGKEVLRYEQVQLDPADPDAKLLIHGTQLLIDHGWVSLQSESHPCEFKDIELMELDK